MPGRTRIRGGSCEITHKEEGRPKTTRPDNAVKRFKFTYTSADGTDVTIKDNVAAGTTVELEWKT